MRIEIHYDESEVGWAHRVKHWLVTRSEQPHNVMNDAVIAMELHVSDLGNPKWGR